jgi:hypothetical protein
MNPTSSSTYSLVRQALLERKLVSAIYRELLREMCPHVLGWKAGKEHCLFFQFAGDSKKGLSPEGAWRCLDLDLLSELAIYAGHWRTGPGYHEKRQSCVDEVDVEIP